MPTGLAIVLLAAGSAVLFYMLLSLLQPPEKDLRLAKLIFTIVFALNGLTLTMVAIPLIHNEAIFAGHSSCWLGRIAFAGRFGTLGA